MKKKSFNALLSLLLVFSLVIGQPAMVYAEETSDVTLTVDDNGITAEDEEIFEEEGNDLGSSNDTEVDDDTDVDTETGNTGDDLNNPPASGEENGAETPDDENNADTDTNDDQQTEGGEDVTTDEENSEPSDQEENTDEEDAEPADDNADGKIAEVGGALNSVMSADKIKMMDELGFTTMALTADMVAEKKEMATVASAIKTMASGDDYAEHEIVFTADTEEEAKKIAECYGGTIIDYDYGVAEVYIEQNVSDAIKVAADMTISIPAVYPNIVYELLDASEFVSLEDVEIADFTAPEEEAEEEVEEDSFYTVVGSEKVYALNPSDEYYYAQWHHDVIHTVDAWGDSGSDASMGGGVLVAVIDTGIDLDHPDLVNNIEDAITVYKGAGEDAYDDQGHGTHCAGIIAAEKNNIFGVGIAPKAKIYSVKVLDKTGQGDTAAVIMGIRAAVSKQVDIMSMSLGSYCYDSLFQKEINTATNKGIVVVAAAGNDSVSQKSYPAAYNNTIAVASTSSYYDYYSYINGGNRWYFEFSDFSNYGSWVDIAAPGGGVVDTSNTNFNYIWSTYPTYLSSNSGVNGFRGNYGTSMACPVVAGTIALMLSNSSSLKNNNTKAGVAKVTKTLLASTDPYEARYYDIATRYSYFYPLVNAEAAAYAVIDSVPQPPTVKFNDKEPDSKGVVLAGEDEIIEFQKTTDHGIIYYTINGKKPTPKTGRRYYEGQKIYMNVSGKVKIQAVTVLGNKTSKVFSKTYTFDVKPTDLTSPYHNMRNDITVAIGKSIQLNVEVLPEIASNKKLEWSTNDATGMIKVNKSSGKVTCNKKATPGMQAIITAKTKDTTKDGKQLEYSFTVTAVTEKVTSLTLNATELNMSYWTPWVTMRDVAGNLYRNRFTLIPSNSGIETSQYLYKSSNTKVATVDAYGNITAWAKGKAKITVTANDGSGLKAVCNVTVVTPVVLITATSNTGYDQDDIIPIATGCSITMKTVVNANSKYALDVPNNKKVNWSPGSNGITVKNGKIKCDKNATAGTLVNVDVSAADNFGTTTTITFRIVDKIEKFYYIDQVDGAQKYVTKKTIEGDVGDAYYDPVNKAGFGGIAYQTANGTNAINTSVTTTVSNRDIIYNHYDSDVGAWVILMTKPGTAKYTISTRDGSNKKFTITYKVKAATLDFTPYQ